MSILTKLALSIAAAIAVTCTVSAEPASEDLRPFIARYQVKYRGLSGGILQLTLRRGEREGEFIYESRAEPSFLGGFMVSASAREISTIQIAGSELRPVGFISDDGKRGDAKDSNIRFDWSTQRLLGRAEGRDFDQPLPARVQDHLSIQIAVIHALRTGAELGSFSLIDEGTIKQYEYHREGPATVAYQGSSREAVIVTSQRTGSSRINRYWHAPSLEFVPVRAERSRDGKVDLTMQLVDIKFPN